KPLISQSNSLTVYRPKDFMIQWSHGLTACWRKPQCPDDPCRGSTDVCDLCDVCDVCYTKNIFKKKLIFQKIFFFALRSLVKKRRKGRKNIDVRPPVAAPILPTQPLPTGL